MFILISYSLVEDSVISFAHTNEDKVIDAAINMSAKDHYTYRMDTWRNGIRLGGSKFYKNGEELIVPELKMIPFVRSQ